MKGHNQVEPVDASELAKKLAHFTVGPIADDEKVIKDMVIELAELEEADDQLPELVTNPWRKKSIRLSRQQSIELELESEAAKEDEIDDLKVDTPLRTIALMFIVSFCVMTTFGIQLYSINTAMLPMLAFVNSSIQSHYDYEVSPQALNWIWTSMICLNLFSEAVGMLISSRIADSKYGRKMGFLVALTLEAIANTGFFLAVKFNTVELFAIMRLVIGFGNGIGMATLTVFVQECTPNKWRGTCACFQELCFSAASIIGLLLGMSSLLGNPEGIAYLLLCPIVANIIMALLVFFALYESPKHLFLGNKNSTKAILAILYYYGSKANAKKILGRFAMEKLSDNDDEASHIFAALKIAYVRRGIVLGIAALLLQLFSGVYFIALYSTQLFTNVGMSVRTSEWLSVAMGVLNTLATFAATGILRRINRRILLLGSSLLCAMIVVTYFSAQKLHTNYPSHVWSYMGVSAILLFNVVYSFGAGPIPWFISSEVVPQKYRSSALGACQFVNMSVFGTMTLFQWPLYDTFGPFTLLILVTLPSLLLWTFLYRRLPETRGKEIAEIVEKLCD